MIMEINCLFKIIECRWPYISNNLLKPEEDNLIFVWFYSGVKLIMKKYFINQEVDCDCRGTEAAFLCGFDTDKAISEEKTNA